jgi:ABC-type transport system involved in multi-copper enzyme maturation permease subunit
MRFQLTLPLLTKELAEQSARRRTYFVRALYALLLYGLALSSFYMREGSWTAGDFSMIGTGAALFQSVVTFQFVAVYALLPLLMAGVLTSEKERDTLGMLLITRLGPWTIIFEKFLSRTIPMLFYLLLSLPLLAVAYTLGGFDSGAVVRAGIALTVCVLQVGALAVFCSAWCRTTSQALVGTYFLLAVVFVAARLSIDASVWEVVPPPNVAIQWRGAGMASLIEIEESLPLERTLFAACNPWMLVYAPSPQFAQDALVALAPMGFLLFLARLSLWPRAFLRPRNWGLKLLAAIDSLMHDLNQNALTRGKVLIHEHNTLPWDKPISWRETARRSFGTTRYLVRLLLLIEVPLLVWLIVPLSLEPWHGQRSPGGIEQWVVWWLGTAVLITVSTGLIAGERAKQTLDVLLSTPLPPEEIVRQKFAGVQRVMLVLAVPFVTTVLVRIWWGDAVRDSWQNRNLSLSLALAWLAVLLYWPLVALLGFECGLRCRTQLQAMTVTLGVLVMIYLAPFVVLRAVPASAVLYWGDWFWWLEPLVPFATAFTEPEFVSYRRSSDYRFGVQYSAEQQWAMIAAHTVCYIAIAALMWWQLPKEFTRVMRRCEPPEPLTITWPASQTAERGA